ncbi:unnamed protein product [Plutella xylostella]|uniref:(diamondback moth) hypothetical protein n=1 Tax=Plutella xylostella TaxID=51655 RepID=A0A8S4FZK8_PLUXY|nr:unnamed protein product [Plutella xylostella]
MDKVEVSTENLCRTCMGKAVDLRSLTSTIIGDRTLSDVLCFVANIIVKPDDKLPKHICADCEAQMKLSDTFKRRCLDVESRFHMLINNSDQNSEVASNLIKSEDVKYPYQCFIKDLDPDAKEELEETVNKNEQDPKDDNNVSSEVISQDDVKEEILDSDSIDIDYGTFPNDFEDYESLSLEDHEKYMIHFKAEDKSIVSCSLCNFVCITKGEHEEHLRKKHFRGKLVKKEPKTKKRKALDRKSSHENIENELEKQEESFVCPVCAEQIIGADAFKKHMKQSHKYTKPDYKEPEKLYECSHCMRKFAKKVTLATHLKRHENQPLPSNPSLTKSEYKNTEKKFECSYCLRKFAKKVTLAAHAKRHENPPTSHVCIICKRDFRHRAHLDNHILSVHTTQDGYKCDYCLKSFPNEDSLKLHKEAHNSEKKHKCPMCEKAFNMLSTLRDHIRVHTGEKPYLCPTCGKGFTQNTNLQEHLRRHQGIKPFKCEMCERRFVSKGELSAHARKHSGAHPFVCSDCGNAFTTSSSLVKHRRTHTGERPYACDMCHMKFAASGTLKNHRRTHTGEKPHKCTHCDKAFVQKNDLAAHMRCHTGERPYVCAACGQAFRQGSALKTHLKMHSTQPGRKDLLMLQLGHSGGSV